MAGHVLRSTSCTPLALLDLQFVFMPFCPVVVDFNLWLLQHIFFLIFSRITAVSLFVNK